MNETIEVGSRVSSRRPSKDHGRGRICACGTHLSRYNPDATCAPCTPPDRKLMVARTRRQYEEGIEVFERIRRSA